MTHADTLMLERLHDRARVDPRAFSSWELDRLQEWRGSRTLSTKQVAILTQIDVRTA